MRTVFVSSDEERKMMKTMKDDEESHFSTFSGDLTVRCWKLFQFFLLKRSFQLKVNGI